MKHIFTLSFVFILYNCFAQDTHFSKKINSLIDFSVDTISVEQFNRHKSEYLILDTRELQEFKISHINKSECVGFEYFNIESFQKNHTNKNQPIAVYCSIGARSEQIGQKLMDAGYSHVKNVYGGIFEWSNQDLPVVNHKRDTTSQIHTYSKEWSIWLTQGIKIYEN